MPRARRLHAPGCIVHVTARTTGRQPWFTESLRTRVQHEILLASESSGHVVLAHTIMPNHFHLIVKQGSAPLDNLMHRVMHRSAALLRWTHKLEGHVFGSRYWSGVCLDAEYARTAIIYVHLNPCRAGLCADPSTYEWTSHHHYVREPASSDYALACAEEGLRLFASDEDREMRRCRYMEHVRFQLAIDRWKDGVIPSSLLSAPNVCSASEHHWLTEYARAAALFEQPQPATTLFDVATHLLRKLDPYCPIDLLRGGTRARKVTTIRKQLIAALLARGYRGVALSRFFGVSETVVSRIAVSLRT